MHGLIVERLRSVGRRDRSAAPVRQRLPAPERRSEPPATSPAGDRAAYSTAIERQRDDRHGADTFVRGCPRGVHPARSQYRRGQLHHHHHPHRHARKAPRRKDQPQYGVRQHQRIDVDRAPSSRRPVAESELVAGDFQVRAESHDSKEANHGDPEAGVPQWSLREIVAATP